MKITSVSERELISFALLGAETQATHLRHTKSDIEELKKIEREIIPELCELFFRKTDPPKKKKSGKH